MPYGGKFRRVDIHGVPMPDRSPTGEGEDDRLPNMAYIDMFDLAPQYSVTDAAVPVEGGELTLEFRRTGGIRSFQYSTDVTKRGITYPSEFILGLGWDTNLNSRIIVSYNPSAGDPTPPKIAGVTDEVGNGGQYFDEDQTGEDNPFDPDVYHSFSNDAVRSKLFRQDSDTLVLVKVFGTRLTYKKVGRFYPPSPSSHWEDYYRLARIEDRNGNRIEYVYGSNDPGNQMSFLVSNIYEATHPERYLQFSYTLGAGSNGEDWGTRLQTVTDPLGRVTSYSFGASDGKAWDLLLEVRREAVPDGENGGVLTQPTVAFSYHTAELPVEETQYPPSMPGEDPYTRNRFVGPNSITDARGHEMTFSYTEDFFPSSIDATGTIYYQLKIRLTGASTNDGSAILTQDERTGERVITRSQDTRGNTVRYEFLFEKVPADNHVGVALYMREFSRTTESLPDANTATFRYSLDPFANLTHVTDMQGNTINYQYGNLLSQKTNQPTQRTITDTNSGETIITTYEYGAFSKMTKMVDGEGKETTYTLDVNGNRTAVNEELGKTTLYQYAADGFITQITDPDGRVTTYSRVFNPGDLNRQYAVTTTVKGYSNELDLDTKRVYNVMGNEVETIDPEENTTTHEYDALYRRTKTTNPAVEASPGGPLVTSTVEYTYNLNGSVVKEKEDNGNVTITTYDLMNRITETRQRMTDPNLNDTADLVTTNTYNPVGLVETTVDTEGSIT
jgi:YD repeat-containing protein